MEIQTLPPSEPSTQAELAYQRVHSTIMPESGPQEPMQPEIQIAGGDERIELSVLRSASGVSPALFTALSK
jgi:hypothetical protein